ncbi:serine/threonine protein phosphatase [Campylobacter sp. MIT 99-7217]|uniref:metallophosphoesterase n=1 Tax=Campylobacter sp. MIT 99-7217 TaxID=535091 RepID=UPI00115A031A|nr:metallophosphoesterase [Campylobacter sp. MIT 99-7217]TQR32370.1 serine/threonine protein phosphatase [Campylobacter sp. MIT 99-7217]
MRTLVILRGNYFYGQEEFIAQNKLEDYLLDLDHLRFLANGYHYLSNGFKSLNYSSISVVLQSLFDFLQMRMQKGEFCVVHSYILNNSLLKRYKDLCDKYRYQFYIIDFQGSLEQTRHINLQRAQTSGVFIPEQVLYEVDRRLREERIPKKYKILDPENFETILYQIHDLSSYKKIHHIGDIQGCFSVLKKAIPSIRKDEFYIFLGDYLDRGIENGKVLKWLLKIKDLPNVVFLEGNHERHLIQWARGENSNSKEFNENTIKDLKKEKLAPKDARSFYPLLKECFYYKFHEKKVFCSHGGLNYFPKEARYLSFIPSHELIMGVGGYEESKIVAEQFCLNTDTQTYELFGHRNRLKLPIKIADRVFLCEGKVDAGGHLRIVSLNKNGFEGIEVKNNVYKK